MWGGSVTVSIVGDRDRMKREENRVGKRGNPSKDLSLKLGAAAGFALVLRASSRFLDPAVCAGRPASRGSG